MRVHPFTVDVHVRRIGVRFMRRRLTFYRDGRRTPLRLIRSGQ